MLHISTPQSAPHCICHNRPKHCCTKASLCRRDAHRPVGVTEWSTHLQCQLIVCGEAALVQHQELHVDLHHSLALTCASALPRSQNRCKASLANAGHCTGSVLVAAQSFFLCTDAWALSTLWLLG